jgi:hypothetical protein
LNIGYTARRVDGEFIRAALGPRAASYARLTGIDSATVFGRIEEATTFPRYRSPLEDSFGGPDGSLWLRLDTDAGANSRWLLIDARDRLRGVVETPPASIIRWWSDDVLWVEVKDAYDVPWLVQYRIR